MARQAPPPFIIPTRTRVEGSLYPERGLQVEHQLHLDRTLQPSIRLEKRLPMPPVLTGLFEFQKEGVEWLRKNPFGLLGDEMGLGKSAQVSRALSKGDRVIIVCPKSLRLNWLVQMNGPLSSPDPSRPQPREGWCPDIRARISKGPDDLVPEKGEAIITNFEQLPDPVSQRVLIRANLSDVRLIVDEAQYVKNYKAQRTKSVSALRAQCEGTWLLTGTPLASSPLDLMGVLKTGGLFQASFGTFDNFVSLFRGRRNKWNGWEFNTKSDDYAEAYERLRRVMLRRTQADVGLELPKTRYTDIPVEIEGTKVLDHALGQWELYSATELPPFELMSAARAELARAKIPAMLEQVEAFESEGLPLLVFSAHRDPLSHLESRKGWKTITGDTEEKERKKTVDAFQAGKLKGLGLSITAAGVGLTLTHAAHELFVDMSYRPGDNDQAVMRAVRIGQQASHVEVRRLIADHPLDYRLTEILTKKSKLIAGVVG